MLPENKFKNILPIAWMLPERVLPMCHQNAVKLSFTIKKINNDETRKRNFKLSDSAR